MEFEGIGRRGPSSIPTGMELGNRWVYLRRQSAAGGPRAAVRSGTRRAARDRAGASSAGGGRPVRRRHRIQSGISRSRRLSIGVAFSAGTHHAHLKCIGAIRGRLHVDLACRRDPDRRLPARGMRPVTLQQETGHGLVVSVAAPGDPWHGLRARRSRPGRGPATPALRGAGSPGVRRSRSSSISPMTSSSRSSRVTITDRAAVFVHHDRERIARCRASPAATCPPACSPARRRTGRTIGATRLGVGIVLRPC